MQEKAADPLEKFRDVNTLGTIRQANMAAQTGFMHIVEENIEAYRACRKHSLDVCQLFIAK
jgi:hypothetical protein